MKTNKLSLSTLAVAFAAVALLSATTSNAQATPVVASQAPTAISQVKPDYSFQLRHDDVEGVVTVAFTVTPEGDVSNPVIVNSTQRRLDKPTLSAIKTWKYRPAMKNGVPVSARVLQSVAFVIPERLG